MVKVLNMERHFHIEITTPAVSRPEIELEIYADGSKDNDCCGAGVFCQELNIAHAISLNGEVSVVQTELIALTEAARLLIEENLEGKSIRIFSDSKNALVSLSKIEINSKTTLKCLKLLNDLSKKNRVTLTWIKSHSGNVGNEEADRLAKTGHRANESLQTQIESTKLKALITDEIRNEHLRV